MPSFIDKFTADYFIFETAIDKNRLALIEADTFPIDAGLGNIEPDH